MSLLEVDGLEVVLDTADGPARAVRGVGFTLECDIQLYFRRQKRAELAFGDADHHRELVAQQLGI